MALVSVQSMAAEYLQCNPRGIRFIGKHREIGKKSSVERNIPYGDASSGNEVSFGKWYVRATGPAWSFSAEGGRRPASSVRPMRNIWARYAREDKFSLGREQCSCLPNAYRLDHGTILSVGHVQQRILLFKIIVKDSSPASASAPFRLWLYIAKSNPCSGMCCLNSIYEDIPM